MIPGKRPLRFGESVRRKLLGAAVLATVPACALAQTSGSWTFNGDGSWSESAKWNPVMPNGGGVAVLGQHRFQNIGHNVTLDIPVTLDSLVFDSPYRYTIASTGTNTLTLTGSAIINTTRSDPTAIASLPTPNAIQRSITGTSGLTKIGVGAVFLNVSNSYTGGTRILGGVLSADRGSALGAPSETLILDGGTLRTIGNGAFGIPNPVTLGAGNATFDVLQQLTFDGVISGPGSFNRISTLSTLNIYAANTYTGATNYNGQGRDEQRALDPGKVFFRSNGSILNTSAINSADLIYLDNSTEGNLNNRLALVPTRLYGAGITLIGRSGVASSTPLGDVIADGGQTYLTITPSATSAAQLTLASLGRAKKGTVIFRGTNLGNTPGAGVGNIFISSAPTLVGGGGTTPTNQSIVPAAIGSTSDASQGDTFVTYGATGVRPLGVTEYASLLSSATSTDNVRLTMPQTIISPQTINALLISGGTISGNGTLTITSGQLLGLGGALVGNIDFGGVEGVLQVPSGLNIPGIISGSAGLVKSGWGAGTLSGMNTYTGATTVLSGQLILNTDILPNAPGALGNSNDPVVIAPGTTAAHLWCNTNATFERDLIVTGNGIASAGFGSNAGQSIVMNGNIQLDRMLTLEAGSSTITINGTISGSGKIDTALNPIIILNHSNSYSGATAIYSGRFYAGDDHAFGSGSIIANGGVIGAYGGPRTIANPLILSSLTIGSISGGGQEITFTGPVGFYPGQMTINSTAGTIANFTGNIDVGAIKKTGPGLVRLLGTNAYDGGTTVADGQLIARNLSNGTLAINAGSVQLTNKSVQDVAATTMIPAVSIAVGAQLDLTNNSVVIDYDTLGTQLTDLRGHLLAGRLISTTLASGLAIGYADASTLGRTTFGGVAIDQTAVVIGEVWDGDANLDGVVNALDFNALASNFGGASGRIWTQGDFNYDGAVNSLDFNALATNFGQLLTSPALGSVVPEPQIVTLALLVTVMTRRRRRGSKRITD